MEKLQSHREAFMAAGVSRVFLAGLLLFFAAASVSRLPGRLVPRQAPDVSTEDHREDGVWNERAQRLGAPVFVPPWTPGEEAEYTRLLLLLRNVTGFFGRHEEDMIRIESSPPLGADGFRDAVCAGSDFADGRVVDDEFGPWAPFLDKDPIFRQKMWEAALLDRPEFRNLDIVRVVNGTISVRNRRERLGFYTSCRKNYSVIFEYLLGLARLHGATLPDVRFLFDCRDGASQRGIHFPFLVASKVPGVKSILVPNFQFALLLLPPTPETEPKPPVTNWESKEQKAIWRGKLYGSDLGVDEVLPLHHPRTSLIMHGEKHPDLLDAKCTLRSKNFVYHCPESHREILQKYCNDSNKLAWEDQIDRFKYMVSVDGYGAAFRVWRMLASGTTPMLPSNNVFVEHYYELLKPWVHFVPSPTWHIADAVLYLRENDALAKRMALNSLRFAYRNLSLRATLCYFWQIWARMAELQGGLDWEGMEKRYAGFLRQLQDQGELNAAVNGSDVQNMPFVALRELG